VLGGFRWRRQLRQRCRRGKPVRDQSAHLRVDLAVGLNRYVASEAGFDYHLVKPADVGMLQSILSMKELQTPADATRH